uniref:GCN5-related N-acetyltransferase n=1 Tax=Cyanothece sp. (strain PCC 7425 / ATCC 29141) TaxID=395961 RepID=B8HKM9_CYAP4
MEAYLEASDVIDWHHPTILQLARQIAAPHAMPRAIARACFEWVRDNINHSVDHQCNPVTWRASDVLQHRTGYCYAKSHLLAALLRANQIPVGFCYQRLSMDDQGAPFALHGFNSIYLAEEGWYRVDPRGNRPGIDAQFNPPIEQLAYSLRLSGEVDFQTILPQPLPIVVSTLQTYSTWEAVLQDLPDVSIDLWQQYGLIGQTLAVPMRALLPEDEAVVWEMLRYAAHESSLQTVQDQPALAQYAQGWGRTGDLGFVALCDQQPIGAAWLRLWREGERGFGWLADSIPELAMAVLPEYRGKGIGTELLVQVLAAAKQVYPAVSLSVREDNPAINLYQRAGFVKVAGSEVINRTGGISFKMLCRFNGS